ncbi:hypothetical protein FI667_g15281, partial [Globisporangium splendens]
MSFSARSPSLVREWVASLFATSLTDPSAATASHEYFLDRLKAWHVTLRQVEVQAVGNNKATKSSDVEGKPRKQRQAFANYYEVLSLDAEYFEPLTDADEPDDEWTVGTQAGPPRALDSLKADRDRLFNEAFSQDLLIETMPYPLDGRVFHDQESGAPARVCRQLLAEERRVSAWRWRARSKHQYDDPAFVETHDLLGSVRTEIVESKKGWMLVNPLMAGFMMLDYQFKYLHLANETLLVTSCFRAFGYLYAALLDSNFIGYIPFFDRILELCETTIFTPSRAAATHGSYSRTYLISSHMTTTAVDAMFRNASQPPTKQAIQKRKCL